MLETGAKIAYVVSMANGLEAFIHREITALRARGIDIELFITKYTNDPIYGPEQAGWRHFHLRRRDVPVAAVNLLFTSIRKPNLLAFALQHRAAREFALACYMAPIMKRRKVVHIHCHFGDRKLTVGFLCAELLQCGLSVTIHAHELHANPNPHVFRVALQRCDRIFAVSDYTRARLLEEFGAPESRVITNRLFVEPNKSRRNCPAVTILTVARFDERKGHKYLIDAAKLLRNENIRFLVIGHGPLDIKKMMVENDLNDSMVIFDRMSQKQLDFFYSKADMFCLPSIDHAKQGPEGIPVVLMEAMAHGLPVVTTATGGTAELVSEVIVSQRDANELANAIRDLANDPARRKRMGENNRKIVEEFYSPGNLNRHTELFSGR